MTFFDVTGAVAFVTGTNKKNGIGRAIVYALLDAGAAKIYATARDASQLNELVEEGEGKVVAVSLDVTDKETVAKLGTAYPDVNLVVNNAGYISGANALDGPEGPWKEMEINYIAPLSIVTSFAPSLEKYEAPHGASKGSAVVNVSSIAAYVSFPLGPTYSASKAAAYSLTQAQRRELPGSLVIGVYPGPIDTDMAANVDLNKDPPSSVGNAVVAALKSGEEDVFPDLLAQQMHSSWKKDAKALEAQVATMKAN